MQFTRRLRPGVRSGRIRTSVRIWKRPRVRVGGRYPMEDGSIVVDSIAEITMDAITDEMAIESGFEGLQDLLKTARHGTGDHVYLVGFHFLPPGFDDVFTRTTWS